eukprot:CAMPEP_0115190542 /NCGR_PEP_ID=MMETSP0270-20121206/12078_1 /TAXON_ID=71861 /ORGANISM="Scrippsiella trochoidea, Strain CCMP3099" /LENGTH=46 /DNA_ID= /DNA_START= /DNA_END= /DNA_ORIENTATION=
MPARLEAKASGNDLCIPTDQSTGARSYSFAAVAVPAFMDSMYLMFC